MFGSEATEQSPFMREMGVGDNYGWQKADGLIKGGTKVSLDRKNAGIATNSKKTKSLKSKNAAGALGNVQRG